MTTILWTDDTEAGLLGSVLRKVSTLLPAKKTAASSVDDTLPIYTTLFNAPLKRRSDFQKAAELALPQLMPLAPDELLIYGRRGAEGVELAAIRKTDMESWTKAGSRFSRPICVSGTWMILPDAHTSSSSKERAMMAAGVCALLIAGAALYFSVLSSLNNQLSGLLAEEQRARASAMQVARKQEEANLWSTLQKARAPARLPAAVLGRLAELSRLTPDGASWIRLDVLPDSITVGGTAADPVAVLGALSGIKGAKAAFSKPVTRAAAGKQEFEIVITYAEAVP